MISKEEALSWLEPVDELGTAPEFDALKAIELIYDSIGTVQILKGEQMIPISEAIGYAEEMLDNVEWMHDVKISENDTGSGCSHIGKRELIHLLGLIYNTDPKTIFIERK
jgi:hypothetical protein